MEYYTPKIEEFHVGFNYEFKVNGEWLEKVYHPIISLLDIKKSIDKSLIRVELLNVENIIGLGFEEEHVDVNKITFIANKNTNDAITLFFYQQPANSYNVVIKTKYSFLGKPSPDTAQTTFKGYLKNVNELKKVLNQLNDTAYFQDINNYNSDLLKNVLISLRIINVTVRNISNNSNAESWKIGLNFILDGLNYKDLKYFEYSKILYPDFETIIFNICEYLYKIYLRKSL
jgi:hypothetical protein